MSATQNNPMHGAWYDLACRISSVNAVAICALETLLNNQGEGYDRINHACNLIAAMQDILNLMQQDVVTIEKALKP